MLDSLYIKNFRNLKEFRIASVDRINLITGKNNTGKSSILEAITVFASKGDYSSMKQLLNYRDEKLFSSMFTDRVVDYNDENTIFIGNVTGEKKITLRFVRYHEEIQKNKQGESVLKRVVHTKKNEIFDSLRLGLEVCVGDEKRIISLSEVKLLPVFEESNAKKFQLIRTANIDRATNGKLFDHIALTEKEQYVIDALKIIEPTTKRIAFIEENRGERTTVIKLSNISEILPLRSMGDGINRILTIILALVNSDNGFLLIDEFENGLHYTVQEQLWKIIFKLSQTLNVQVFATTHSEDCISGFQRVLNSSDNSKGGKLIRLDNINGIIKPVEYSSRELKIANEQDIETR